jgi:hypothetical protein
MSFLTLPGELRNAIYDQVLFPHCETIQISQCSSTKDVARYVPATSPIFHVSKQTRIEALARLFAKKRFDFLNTESAFYFLKFFHKFAEDRLVDVRLVGHMRSDLTDQLCSQLSSLKALKRIEFWLHKYPIDLEETPWRLDINDEIKGSEGFHSLKEVLQSRGVDVIVMEPGWNYLPIQRPVNF